MSVVSFISDSINYAHAIIKLLLFIFLHSCFDFSFFFFLFFDLFVLLCNPSWFKLTLEKDEREIRMTRESE